MTPLSSPLLEVDDLSVTFPGAGHPVRALDGVSFRLERGETLGIAGESGSGKTVTALSILRLLAAPARIGGRILFEGEDVLRIPPDQLQRLRGKRIGMIFQDPTASLNPVIKVGRQVSEALKAHQGLNRAEAELRALVALEEVGVRPAPRRARQFPHQLSGGMCQRVAIAIALSTHPSLLIADEATTALDVSIQAQILNLVRRVQREQETALIMISHDLGVLAGMTDRVVVMYAGRIVESAPTSRLFSRPAHPYTSGLLACIPRVDRQTLRRVRPIPGTAPSCWPDTSGCAFAPRCPAASAQCLRESPPLAELEPAHLVACWHPRSVDHG